MSVRVVRPALLVVAVLTVVALVMTPGRASEQLSPPPGADPSLDWLAGLPFDQLAEARGSGGAVVLLTAGGFDPRSLVIPFGEPVPVDLDDDDQADLTIAVGLAADDTGPAVRVDVERLTTPGPSDVEVLALAPVEELTGSEGDNLLLGFRTAGPGGTVGGTLAAQQRLLLQIDELAGLTHQVGIEVGTGGATGPLRLLGGPVGGVDDLADAALATLLVDDPPATIDLTFGVDATSIGAAEPSASIDLTWAVPSADRPDVELSWLETEDPGEPAFDTVLAIDQIDPVTSVSLALTPDVEEHPEAARLSLTSGSSLPFVGARIDRPEGFRVEAGLTDAPTTVDLRVAADDDAIVLDAPGGDLDVVLDLTSDRAILPLGLSRPLDELHVRLLDAPSLRIQPQLSGSTPGVAITPADDTDQIGAVRFAAGDDLAAAPATATRPAGDLRALPDPGADADVALVDDADGSLLYAEFLDVGRVAVDPGAEELRQSFDLDVGAQTVEAELRLDDGTPLAPAGGASGTCQLVLSAGPVQLAVADGDVTAATGGLPRVACDLVRGSTTLSLDVRDVPAILGIQWEEAVAAAPATGRFDLTAQDEFERDDPITDLTLVVSDPDGLTGDVLLGAPVVQFGVEGRDLPSLSGTWSTAAGTAIDVAATGPEGVVDRLGIVLRTTAATEVFDGVFVAGNDVYDVGATLRDTTQGTVLATRVSDLRDLEVSVDDTVEVGATFEDTVDVGVSLQVGDDSAFGDAALDGSCQLDDVAAGVLGLVVDPAASVQVTSSSDGLDRLDCTLDRTSEDDDVRLQARAEGLGGGATVVASGTGLAIDTAAPVADLVLKLEDRSGDGLFDGAQLFGGTIDDVGLTAHDLDDGQVLWGGTDTVQGIEIVADDPATPMGTLRAHVRRGSAALTFLTPDTDHAVRVLDNGTDLLLEAVLVDVTRLAAGVDRTAAEAPFVTVAAAERPLELELDTTADAALSGGRALDVTAQVEDVPGDLEVRVADGVRVEGSAPIDAVRLDATTPIGASPDAPVRLEVLLEGLPRIVDVDLSGDRRVDVTSSASVALVDVLAERGGAGLFDRGVGAARVTLEDVPTTFAVDLAGLEAATSTNDGGGVELDADAVLSAEASAAIGRVAVELTAVEDALFGLPYRHLRADVRGIPLRWYAQLVATADGGGIEVGAGTPDATTTDRLDRVEVAVATKRDGRGQVATLLDQVAGDQTDLLARTSWEQRVDDRMLSAGEEARVDDLFDDPVGVPTTTRTVRLRPWTEPAEGETTRRDRVASTPHAVARLRDDDLPSVVSARVDGLSRVTVTADGRVDVERATRGDDRFALALVEETNRTGTGVPYVVGLADPDGPIVEADNLFIDVVRASQTVDVLKNDEPRDPEDPTDALDPASLTVVEVARGNGDATVEDGKIVWTRTAADRSAGDGILYEVCSVGRAATDDALAVAPRCNQGSVEVVPVDFFDEETVVTVDDLPDRFGIEVASRTDLVEDDDGEEQEVTVLERIDVTTSGGGRLDAWIGPSEPLVTTAPELTRAIVYDLPGTLGLDVEGLSAEEPGVLVDVDLTTDRATDLVLLSQSGTGRRVVGIDAEDIALLIEVDGAIDGLGGDDDDGDGETTDLEFGSCRFDAFGCAQIAYAGLDLDLRGQSVSRGSGFLATWDRTSDGVVRLDDGTPTSGSPAWSPRWHLRFDDVGRVDVAAELQFDPFCIVGCLVPLVDLEGSVGLSNLPSVDLDFWDRGVELCADVPADVLQAASGPIRFFLPVPVEPEMCLELDGPDVRDADPWDLLSPALPPFTFDPYEGRTPVQPDSALTQVAAGQRWFAPLPGLVVLNQTGRTIQIAELFSSARSRPSAALPRTLRVAGDGPFDGVALASLAVADDEVVCAYVTPDDGSPVWSVCSDDLTGSPDVLPSDEFLVSLDRPATVTYLPAGTSTRVTRLAGPDRVGTGVLLSRGGWVAAEQAVLATARSFPDALAAAPLAGRLDAPLLLTEPDQLPDAVVAELQRLGVTRVTVVGGETAVAPAVVDRLLALGIDVERLGGATRYDTAALLLTAARTSSDVAYVASGANFPDALAAAPLAARDGVPIALVDPAGPTEVVVDALRDAGVTTVQILGGEVAVSAAAEAALADAGFRVLPRLAGPDRYATARAVVDAAGDVEGLLVATGRNFPDALAAGALGGRLGLGLVLVDPATDASTSPAAAAASDTDRLVVVGGPVAVPQERVDELLPGR